MIGNLCFCICVWENLLNRFLLLDIQQWNVSSQYSTGLITGVFCKNTVAPQTFSAQQGWVPGWELWCAQPRLRRNSDGEWQAGQAIATEITDPKRGIGVSCRPWQLSSKSCHKFPDGDNSGFSTPFLCSSSEIGIYITSYNIQNKTTEVSWKCRQWDLSEAEAV